MNEQHLDALPPVQMNQAPEQQAAQQGGEAGNPGQGELPGSPMGAPAATPFVNPLAPPPAAAADDAVSAAMSAPTAAPGIADDIDLIEKEWVEKAKHIVEQTKHDPHKQNEEMTKMKVDYLKKRYNRSIKMDDVV